jgi:hypothetical protein
VTQPRAADDFEVIRERLEELRREREENTPKDGAGDAPEDGEDIDDAERRRRDRVEGLPPPWVPTIFLPQPTD